MPNTTQLCNYVATNNVLGMTTFLADHPNSLLINTECDISKVSLGNGISAGNIFGSNVTILFYSVVSNNTEMVSTILNMSTEVKIDSMGIYQDTPLMVASLSGNYDIVKILVNRDANVSLIDEHGNNALHKVASGHDFKKITGQPFFLENYVNIAELLLDQGININAYAYAEGQPDGTPLNVALEKNFFDISKFLLDQGADAMINNHKTNKPILCGISKFNESEERDNLLSYVDIEPYPKPGCALEKNTCRVGTSFFEQVCGLPTVYSYECISETNIYITLLGPLYTPLAIISLAGAMLGLCAGSTLTGYKYLGDDSHIKGMGIGLVATSLSVSGAIVYSMGGFSCDDIYQ